MITRRTALAAAASLPALCLANPPMAEAQTVSPQASPQAPLAEPALAAATPRPLFGATLWTLPNGMTVAHVEQRRAPVVAHYVFLGAGAGEDVAGKSGTAHFLEHMMFKGSPKVESGVFSRRVAREGGQDNAFTSRDITGYYQHVESSRLDLVAAMEADRQRAALIPQAELESERQVVLEERNQRTDSSPQARFREELDATMWGRQHWRGRPIIGWPEEIRAITRDDILEFHRNYYSTANATLVVAGAVSADELRKVVEQEYGGIPQRAFTPRARAAPPSRPVEPRLIRTEARVTEASLTRTIAAPSHTWGETRHALPLEVLAHLLGGGTGSRLNQALVETGIALSAGAAYDGDVLGVASFGLYATARPGTAPARLEAALMAEIDKLLQSGATEAEVARSRRQLTAGALLALDGLGAAPRLIGGALAIGLPVDAVEQWPARIRAVTAEQVNAAARAVLNGTLAVTGWLGPQGAELPA